MQILLLLIIFIICAVASLLFCSIARTLFPKFRSGEHKPGTHRPDLPAGGREIKTIELPLVGGPALTLAIAFTGIGAGYLLDFKTDQWQLLLIGLGATLGYTLVGFIDDWNKVYSNEGLSERAKLAGVFLISIAAALLFFYRLPQWSQQPYSPWKDLPILNTLLCAPATNKPGSCNLAAGPAAYFVWLVSLMVITGVVGSVTSLSVDFSDGLDGLAGGLVFSAALALGIVVTGFIDPKNPDGIVLEVLALLCAAGVLGYLPWNWPSSWAARRGTAKRRAKIYMGDSGALGLGGLLAMIAIFAHNETLLIMIGGAFVLEGLSALISARLMTRFFRRQLQILRFANSEAHVPHTEFPLPFLATPLHHHFDLLGWDRRRLVYGAWALGAGFAALGVIVNIVPQPWERYLLRIIILVIACIVWSSGSWSKSYFVGKHPAERHRRRRLALYYGYPYRLMGIKLYHMVEVIEASEDVIETPAEELALWQRMNIFDARSMLGLYCYRAGYYPAALAQWTRIPERNRVLRPEIVRLLTEVDNRLALEQQETQPMRRDQLNQLLKNEPILSGNLSPADLPNPHEPIRSEETENPLSGTWATSRHNANNEEDEEEHQVTSPLHNDIVIISSPDGQHTTSPEHIHNNTVPASQQSLTTTSPTRQNWLSRLLRLSSKN